MMPTNEGSFDAFTERDEEESRESKGEVVQ